MFVGRSEISKSVIVKDMQHVGIIRIFCLPGKLAKFFSAWGGYKKLMGCGLLGRWESVPRLTLCYPMNSNFSVVVHI